MKKPRFTDQQIAFALQQAEAGDLLPRNWTTRNEKILGWVFQP